MAKKIGLMARVDDGGLATLTQDFWKHLPQITRTMSVIVQGRNNDHYRFPKTFLSEGYPSLGIIDEFLQDIDIVLALETPYNWNIFSKAKERGIKSILMPMYEWTQPKVPIHPDLYLCPSRLDYDIYKEEGNAKYLPVPVDRKELPFNKRTKAKTFLFNNGGGGSKGRNGASELLQAIPQVKSDVRFIINSQIPIQGIRDNRIEVRLGSVPNKADLFKEGDVFLFPHKFNGLSLPIQEALSCGMPVLSTDIYPHNDYLPQKWLFEHNGLHKGKAVQMGRDIDIARLDPKKIAEKIDEYANKDISKDSERANKIAKKLSWENLKPKYNKLFEEL